MSRPNSVVPSAFPAVRRWLRAHWWLIAVVGFAALEAIAYFPIRPTRAFPIDAGRFLYGGTLLASGYAPYLNMWAIKPPMIYALTGSLAFVTSDPWVMFYLGTALTALAAVAVVALAGALVYRLTDRPFAAFVTCVTISGFNTFVVYSIAVPSPKYFMLALGLAGIWASLDGRDVLAAALATAAAGFWQWGLLFVLLVYGRAFRRDRLAHWRRMLGASVAVTAVAVAPIVIAGAAVPMVRQVMVDVFLLSEDGTVIDRAQKFTRYLDFLWPLVVVGAAGAFDVAIRKRDHYWILAGVAWAGVQVFLVDFETGPDLFVLLVFCAVGLGVTVGTVRLARHQQVLVVCLVLVLAGAQLYDHRAAFGTPPVSPIGGENEGVRGAFIAGRIPPETCTLTIGTERIERLYTDDTPRVCDPPPLLSD